MSAIPAIGANTETPAYNGVKIRVNNPVVVTPVGNNQGDKNYNAVDIEVNNPRVVPAKPIYNYPKADKVVTYNQTGINAVNLPPMPPVAYQATKYVTNHTIINAEIVPNDKKIAQPAEETKPAEVPEPNYTTVEAEKTLTFNGLDNVEIVSVANIKPEIDINSVIAKLNDKNFDVQAIQLEEIARTATEEPVKAIPYIVTDVYNSLDDIIKSDTSGFEKPSENQTEIRKRIIINQIFIEEALNSGKDPKSIKLPYQLTKDEISEAVKLSPFEQAERNKEYAILTSALLTKIFIDENYKETGIVTPITDLPGVSSFVNVLRKENNPELKSAAIDALLYLKRAEYNNDLKNIFEMTSQDKDEYVRQKSMSAIEILNK